jgi:hypothetical protein
MKFKRGDILRDNNPDKAGRELKIVEAMPNGVAAQDRWGRVRLYLMRSIHTDGKPRKSGFTLVTQSPELLRLAIVARTLIGSESTNKARLLWLEQADEAIARETGSQP